jgi:hypothetical protein
VGARDAGMGDLCFQEKRPWLIAGSPTKAFSWRRLEQGSTTSQYKSHLAAADAVTLGRNPVRLDLECHTGLIPSPSLVRRGTV